MKRIALLLLVFCAYCISAHADDKKWYDSIHFSGDVRVRYEGTAFDDEAVKDRNRFRYRLRLAADTELAKNLKLHMRFASGEGEATSTNETFDSSFSDKKINIDRVYVGYKLNSWEIAAGKVKNPFNTTNIVWDEDVNQEGFYQKYKAGSFYAVFSEFFVEEESSRQDTNLYAAQIGYEKEKAYNLSLAYYNYVNAKFGSLVYDYEFLEAVATFHVAKDHMLQATYVSNTTSEVTDEDTAWAVFYEGKEGPWSYGLKYAHIEANSSHGLFTDSDFGFNDKKGFAVSLAYKINKASSFKATYFNTDSILAVEKGFDRLQLDLNYKF